MNQQVIEKAKVIEKIYHDTSLNRHEMIEKLAKHVLESELMARLDERMKATVDIPTELERYAELTAQLESLK